jgi:trk system potassium uptake protein TrkA
MLVGAGRIGESIIGFLEELGIHTRVIDRDPERCSLISRKYSAAVFHGDGRDEELLKIAGTDETDVLVACTDDDETNLEVCRIAKEKFSVPRVIARINYLSTNHEKFIEYADVILSERKLLIRAIENAILQKSPNTLYEDEDSRLIVIRAKVPTNSSLIGSKVKDLLGDDKVAALLIRNGKVEVIDDDTEIMYGDELIIAGERDKVTMFASMLLTKH